MEIITTLIKYWREITIGILLLALTITNFPKRKTNMQKELYNLRKGIHAKYNEFGLLFRTLDKFLKRVGEERL